ncbi:MAG TPA: hypothetical protein VD902_16005 [Symbiobacteriaceae bacterium]|nr:hypothetical protein [Symbiobacteriaceae bacterium]
MPLEFKVHAVYCPKANDGVECRCTPRAFTDPDEAVKAHEGNAKRLEITTIIRPPIDWAIELPPVPAEKSQARTHRAISD